MQASGHLPTLTALSAMKCLQHSLDICLLYPEVEPVMEFWSSSLWLDAQSFTILIDFRYEA